MKASALAIGEDGGEGPAILLFVENGAVPVRSHEVVVDYALRLKREFDAGRLWINAYCDEVSVYIASDRLIGEGGYEVNNSLSATVTHGHPGRLVPTLETRIVGMVRSMLPGTFLSPASSGK